MPDRPQILAAGRGGPVQRPESPLADFFLSLTEKDRPRVCYLPTATGDSDAAVAAFYRAFSTRDCTVADVQLFRRGDEHPRDALLRHDAIWVAGGNTANALAVWRAHGVDVALREAWESGVVLAGSSAGMICWFEASITDSFGPALAPLHDGLGFLPGSACPHYDGEERRRPVFHAAIAGGLPAGFAADDGCALHFVGTELREVVSASDGATAYRVERAPGGEVAERALAARALT